MMTSLNDFLKIWQGSQNLRATQNVPWVQTKPMTAVGYISDTWETVNVSCSYTQHDRSAAFQLSERLSELPAVSTKNLAEGHIQVLNVA
jgi:hypothetical protein